MTGDTHHESGRHPLPELLDGVLNGENDELRAGGWRVKLNDVLTVDKYDEPPEAGGHYTNVAVFEP